MVKFKKSLVSIQILLIFFLLSVARADLPSKKVYYWIQPLKGHPVHQLTQIAFLEKCRELKMTCQVIGASLLDIPQTIALAEEILSRGDAAGMAIWAGSPAWKGFIEKASSQNIPVIVPHFPISQGEFPGLTGIIHANPLKYSKNAAEMMCQAIGKKIGSIAITQGDFNPTENTASKAFSEQMKKMCSHVQVLAPQAEGFDPAQANSIAVSLMQAHPNLLGVFSTTGGGAFNWAKAQKEVSRNIVVIGVDYTRVNLDLIKNGEIFGVVGQPLIEESSGSAELLNQASRGQTVPFKTELNAELITKSNYLRYLKQLDHLEKQLKNK
jgi:ribose transport system substrate-binding protein